jgi:tripartite-type tricarboxylate transporter receptor subunit TctC
MMSHAIVRRRPARSVIVIALTAATLGWTAECVAQAAKGATASYPVRPVRMIVGTDPGAAPDILARIVAEKLGEHLGHQVVVDNRPGAAAVLGAEIVSRAQPDGYTLMVSAAIHTVTPNVYRKMPYHPIDSFTPVARIASSPFILIASPGLGTSSVKDLIAYAKANPGKLNYSSPGNGSIQHLSGEMLGQRERLTMTHVPYKSGAASVTAILTGDVQFCFVGLPPALPHILAGRVRPLAVTTSSRFPTVADVPTAEEAGLAGFEADNWHAVIGPAGIPKALVARLNAEIVKVLARTDVKERMLKSGATVNSSTSAELHELLRSELAKWAKAAKAAGVQPDR